VRPFPIASAAVAGILLVGATTGYAFAHHIVIPSKKQVHHAQHQVQVQKGRVATIEHQLTVAQNQLQSAYAKEEGAVEDYNGAAATAKQKQTQSQQAALHANQALASVDQERKAYAAGVIANYQMAPQLSLLAGMAKATGFDEIQQQTAAMSESQNALNSEYSRYQASSTLAKVAAVQARKAAKAAEAAEAVALQKKNAAAAIVAATKAKAAQVNKERSAELSELAHLQHVSKSLETKRQNGLEELARERAAKRKLAAEKAAAAAASYGIPPSTPAGATAAIEFARAQIGEPYVWAAAGPNDWDCSGLTMMAWEAGGINLPHHAATQYALSTPISPADLRPGDLVFWGYTSNPDSIHHVALYVGNGMIIQAPHTGADVDEVSMYSWIAPNFFARP